ncbi:MAG: CsbD family protein [Pseudomonadota bacterium]|nr:CsbD family protein [Pseudomonadota bacterium]
MVSLGRAAHVTDRVATAEDEQRVEGIALPRRAGRSCPGIDVHSLTVGFAPRCVSIAIGGKHMGELIDKAKGRVKQAAGKLTGSKKLEREGERDELKGKVEGVVEQVKHDVKDKLE